MYVSRKNLLLLSLLLPTAGALVAGAPGSVPIVAAEDVAAATTGSLSGTVTAPGAAVAAANGALENAVVYLKGITPPKGWNKPATPCSIELKAGRFNPGISIVPVDAPVTFENGDVILHGIKALCVQNDVFQEGVRGKGSFKLAFAHPEIIHLGCTVHPAEDGVLVVAAHAWYALTDAKGSYTLPGIPPGTYRLHVWHETLGVAKHAGTSVTIQAGTATTADVAFPDK